MRTLKKQQLHNLYEQYRSRERTTCPQCSASLMVVSTPSFLVTGRLTHITFSVACPECGASGAVRKTIPAPTARR